LDSDVKVEQEWEMEMGDGRRRRGSSVEGSSDVGMSISSIAPLLVSGIPTIIKYLFLSRISW